LFLALLPAVLPAQTPTGVIQGLVTDASGAVVPQAKIVVVNIATNETREVRTDEAGRYVVPYLLPGFYHVTAEGTGFRPVRQENIKLDVGQNRTISFQLEVGAVTQEIRVDAAPPPVDLNNATVSQVVENKRIVDLPLNGRSAFALAGLSPGVNPTGGGATPHISGSQTSTSEVQIDGTTTVTAGVIGGMNRRVYEPQVDAVEEFSVQVNGLSAEFGRFAGGVINAVTKSGTNKLHGSAYDFLRNQKLDANNFFANRAGRPKGPFKRNQWGGTVGGPVYLPKLYDGRDKTFFFVGFEGTNARSQSVYTGTVPIAAWRGGDFSDLRSSGGTPIIIYDPLTGRPDPANPARFIRDPFTGNRVPQNRFDVTAVNAMKFFPQPNATPVNAYTNANNYVTTGAVPSDSYRTDIRGDHNWTENWRMFLRVSLGWSKSTPLYSYGNAATPTDGSGPSEGRSRSVTLDQVFTFSPTLIGNLRYGLGRLVSDRMPFGAGFDVTSLGFPKYLDESAARNIRIFPKMSFSGAVGDLGQNHTRAFEASLTHNLNFSVTKILSRHNFKFGGEYRKFYVNYYQFCCSSSNFSFSPNWTQQEISTTSATAGHPLASFLLGLPAGGSASHTATTTVSSSYWAGYIQDDWKLTSRLTLNLGLRFEVEAPRTDRFNNLSYFNLYDPSPLAGKVPASACRNCGNLAGNMYFVDENNRRQLATNWSNIGPRIGFAFAMDSKTSFRGGYGIMYPPSPATAGGASIGVAGFSGGTSFIGTLDSMRTVKTYMRDPFPDGFNYPQARAGGAEQFLGFGAGDSVFDGNGSPYVQQWNFTIQRSLPGSWVIEAGYLGSRGIKLIDGDSGGDAGDPLSQLRAEDMQLGNELLRVVPNPFFGLITSPTSALSARTVEYRQLLRPYPHYSDISIHRRPQAQSTYHAMTLRAERRFAQGLSFLLAYTAGKSIDDGSAVAWWEGPTSRSFLDHYNRPLERSVSSWDVAQRAIISFVYEFPFGKGKPLLADLPKGLNMLVSGWQTNGILTFQSGTPVMVTVPVNNTFIYTRSQRANSVPGKSARITGGTTDERLLKWFDTSIFSAPPSFTFGQVGRTLPDVRNPGNRLVDLSFFKNTYFGPENRLNLQYRLEMFGAFNTPQFGAPGASVGASNFGVISSAGGARQIQMALKLLW
jgi:hypothetical protein